MSIIMNVENVIDGRILTDVGYEHFGSFKTPLNSCIFLVDPDYEIDIDDENAFYLDYDACFLKGPRDVVRDIYDKTYEYYRDDYISLSANEDGQLLFGLYYLSKEETIMVAIDASGDFWGDGFFDLVYPDEIDEDGLPAGISFVDVCHANINNCIDESPDFFDEETLNVLFSQEDIKER